MENHAGLIQLQGSELNISGGHCVKCHSGTGEGLFTWHQVYDFMRGVWDGYTNA